MRVLILDDEEPAIKLLALFVEKTPNIQLVLATTNVDEALQALEKNKIDLFLLDIEMPDINGVELLKSLTRAPLVILTTAYEKYAIEGFNLNVVDYLLKPIRYERFLQGIIKAHTLYKKEAAFIHIKSNYKTIKIMFEDILFIEGLKDYVKVHTLDKIWLTRLNIKNINEKLPESYFLRVHKSYIISIPKITSFQKHHLFILKKKIPIGDTYVEKVYDILS